MRLQVKQEDIDFAKKQITEFEKTDAGSWRYKGVEAWRGIVCEMLTAKWLAEQYTVTHDAKGLDTSGVADDYDLIIGSKKVEIKSATKNYFKKIMPKIHDINDKPKDIYVGAKYDETVEPNCIDILGYLTRDDIREYPIDKNMGASYYDVPISAFKPITKEIFE
ncbi:hypothetical protein Q765_13010 [Flavobacterium rivuli WB 3.3-2 = DSM 21788]|uniref:Uncharacterized protein n=1 Tax=Flavobacterium rivuli WB 3.3-2 = DSM 21788 TaxID=1121895 RepID=A0A0A2M130_9FLAO|nr:hypothetical protein [Flavobacterium rivuli]KGO85979.1 hypothetical protein Q765_13010 [Flavobacterium rivuli WB 3.3-2 = DSM 21788]